MNDAVAELVAQSLAAYPPEFRPPDLASQLVKYLQRLMDTNRNINLVSRRDTAKHVERFTRECLFLARLLVADRSRLALKRPPRLLDLGSGGGFPGIVLKLALGDVEVQLVEGTGKKATFLAEVAAALDLRQTSVLWGRAEELSNPRHPAYKPAYRHHFDWVTGKGLGTLQDSTRLAAPFLESGGAHWTFKGAACGEELKAASGFFRQKGFAPLHVERLPGDLESYVVGIRRLSGNSFT